MTRDSGTRSNEHDKRSNDAAYERRASAFWREIHLPAPRQPVSHDKSVVERRCVAVQRQNGSFEVVVGGEWRLESGCDFEEGGRRHGVRAARVALQQLVGRACHVHEAAGWKGDKDLG